MSWNLVFAHQTERRRLQQIQAIQVLKSNSFSKFTSAYIIVCHKAEIYRLLSLSSIACSNEYLALLIKRTKLYFFL